MKIIGSIPLLYHAEKRKLFSSRKRNINDIDVIMTEKELNEFEERLFSCKKVQQKTIKKKKIHEFKNTYTLSFKEDNFFPIFIEVEIAKESYKDSISKSSFMLLENSTSDMDMFFNFIYTFQKALLKNPTMNYIDRFLPPQKDIFLDKKTHEYFLITSTNDFKSLYANPFELYAIKASHKYKKFELNQIQTLNKFNKTMSDIKLLNEIIFSSLQSIPESFIFNYFSKNQEKNILNNDFFWFKDMKSYFEKQLTLNNMDLDFYQELYQSRMFYNENSNNDNFKLPSLNVSKEKFFKEEHGFYKYDHDSIHEVLAIKEKPAYTYYMKENEEVMTDKEKFFSCSDEIKLLGVIEEAMVLACERVLLNDKNQEKLKHEKHLVNMPQFAFNFCLKKVCSTITSGYFREFAYINFDNAVKKFYELNPNGNEYYIKLLKNIDKLKPFKK